MATRIAEAVPQLGSLRHIEASMCAPIFPRRDIRYSYELAGGAGMDVGAYAVSMMRYIAAASGDAALRANPEVISTRVKLRGEHIDRLMKVDVRWSNGVTGHLHFSMLSPALLKMSTRVIGENGELYVNNPYHPHMFNRFKLRLGQQKTSEKIAGEANYNYQLREFVQRINQGEWRNSYLEESIATMEIIDSIYDAAGMPRRGQNLESQS